MKRCSVDAFNWCTTSLMNNSPHSGKRIRQKSQSMEKQDVGLEPNRVSTKIFHAVTSCGQCLQHSKAQLQNCKKTWER